MSLDTLRQALVDAKLAMDQGMQNFDAAKLAYESDPDYTPGDSNTVIGDIGESEPP